MKRRGGDRGRKPARPERGKAQRGRATPERGRGKPERGRGQPERGRGKPERGRGDDRAQAFATHRPSRAPEERTPYVRPMVKQVTFPPPAPVRIGEWLLTTRAGAEQDLLEELSMGAYESSPIPRLAGPALVAVPAMPKRDRPELAFARQGFPVTQIVRVDEPGAADRLAEGLLRALPEAQGRAARERGPEPFALDTWVPDDDRTNPEIAAAERLRDRVLERFSVIDRGRRWPRATDARAVWTDNGLSAQLCVAEGAAYLGVLPARDLPSLAPGGRLRVHVPKHAPSRAAAKLLEAFIWLDRAPEPGEMCADLGAAPGGWSWVLLERKAKVLAIDPAKLDPLVAKRPGLTHLRADAFKYQPEGFVDWLVADMAWRPLEAAALYGKWGRRGWARMLIANIKLPMKKKAEMILRVKDILGSSGWGNLRVRQLYHDREEVTVAGVLQR
jgi:23S rRNA (cytidine2498-2'-O)-methyltransferase